MTDRDVLKRASEALREASEPSQQDLLELRQRVLGAQVLSLSKARRRKPVHWLLPLVAALVAGTALAATPSAWEGMLRTVERFLDVEILAPSHERAPAAGQKKRVPALSTSKADAAPTAPALSDATPPREEALPAPLDARPQPPAQAERQEQVALPATPQRVHKAGVRNVEAKAEPNGQDGASEAAPEPSAAAAEPESAREERTRSRDLSLYQAAHELHFRARRYDEALRAWEVYLAQTPTPTFALEARYNRALCLLRLGHYEEARAALRPFAEGRVLGSYRRKEASDLIQALDKRR